MAVVIEETEEDGEQNKSTSSIAIVTLDRKASSNSNRLVTDVNWCFLFIFIFVTWIASWYYASFHHAPPDLKIIEFENNSRPKNETEFTQYHFWEKSWLFDTITCNVAFKSVHYENNGWIVITIVIAAKAFLSIALVKYSISSMRNNYTFQSQLDKACFYLVLFTICFRFLAYLSANHLTSENVINFLVQPSHEKMSVWWMPELIFITVWYTKKCYKCNDPLFVKYYDEMRPFNYVLMPFIVASLAVFCSLYMHTMNIAYELGWKSVFSYVIIGGSCYFGLTIFYYLSLVISCATYYAVGEVTVNHGEQTEERSPIKYNEFVHAFRIVGRYHFGTACYHATLIFPRLHSLFVMNEPEFRETPKYVKFIDRFCATQCKLHSLSLMSTAVGGTNHADSMRGLLRHYATDSPPKLQYFQAFRQINISAFTFFVPFNALTIITLWICGLEDPRLFLATWAFYIRLMIILIVPMKFLDMASDTISLVRRAPFTPYDLFDVVVQYNYSPVMFTSREYELPDTSDED